MPRGHEHISFFERLSGVLGTLPRGWLVTQSGQALRSFLISLKKRLLRKLHFARKPVVGCFHWLNDSGNCFCWSIDRPVIFLAIVYSGKPFYKFYRHAPRERLGRFFFCLIDLTITTSDWQEGGNGLRTEIIINLIRPIIWFSYEAYGPPGS